MNDPWLKLKSGTDIRGLSTSYEGREPTLTREKAARIGYAFALWLSEKTGLPTEKLTVSVGRDPRESSGALAQGVIEGLTAADCDVFDCGLSTTPAMIYTTIASETDCDGAVMVTGSHHPWPVGGLKLSDRGGSLAAEDVEAVLLSARDAVIPQRLVTKIDFLALYRERLAGVVRALLETDVACPLLGLHVVVDAAGGAGGFYADFLEELGAEVTGSRGLTPEPRFEGCGLDAPDALAELSRAVVDSEADMGVLFDADCDRAAIVDEAGRAVNKNRLIALIAAILLEETPGATFVTDSVTSTGLQTFITEWGGVHYRFKRGYRNVIREAIRLNEEGIDCPLAIETSGHAAFRENHFVDDGMYLATRLVCEALKRKREGETLTSLIEELHEPVEFAEIRMNILPDDFKAAGQSVIETVLSNTLTNPAWRLATDNREGVRILFDLDGGVGNGWFQLRLSVHDPVMALNAESDVPGGVSRMLTELYELIQGETDLDLEPLKHAIG